MLQRVDDTEKLGTQMKVGKPIICLQIQSLGQRMLMSDLRIIGNFKRRLTVKVVMSCNIETGKLSSNVYCFDLWEYKR